MFRVVVRFYGRGNSPRTLRGFADRYNAEEQMEYLRDRYEHQDLIGVLSVKNIKSICVEDEHGNHVVGYHYGKDYQRDFIKG